MDHQEADGEGEGGVNEHLVETALGEAAVALVGEGGEGGEAAAEADGEKHPPVLGNAVVAVEKSVQQPDKKSADDVDGKSAPKRRRPAEPRYKPPHAVAGHPAQKATQPDKSQYLNHFCFVVVWLQATDRGSGQCGPAFFFGDGVGHHYGFADVVADALVGNKAVDTGLVQTLPYRVAYA